MFLILRAAVIREGVGNVHVSRTRFKCIIQSITLKVLTDQGSTMVYSVHPESSWGGILSSHLKPDSRTVC